MNEVEGNDKFSIPDPWDVTDLCEIVEAWKEGSIASSNQSLIWQLEELSGLTKQQLFDNRTARDLLRQFNNGLHADVVSQMTVYNPNRFNRTMVREGIVVAYKNKLKSIAKNSINIYSLLSPFISTFFSEATRAALANGMVADMSDNVGINVTANTPID